MTIREAEITDLPQLAVLFNAYRVFYQQQPELDSGAGFLKERISQQESVIYIAILDEEVVGFVQLYPIFSSVRMKRLWLLNDLFVAEEVRGQGISIALIDKAKELCLSSGACGFMLETTKDNAIANILYQKMGLELDTAHNIYSWDA
nr:GNAT family N-acetyltransferase [uncultured Mucilaginibacter sp.]